MPDPNDDFDLDFTRHFTRPPITREKVVVPEKVTLDPEFRIGAAKLESEGYFCAVARRRSKKSGISPGRRVMVVEDDPVTNAVLLRVLSIEGFEAHGSIDAVGLAQKMKEHGLPDLILLDIELPQVGGLQILSRLRKHPKLRATPVLIVTGRANISDLARGMALGADGYVTKPATVESLRSVIKEILGGLPKS